MLDQQLSIQKRVHSEKLGHNYELSMGLFYSRSFEINIILRKRIRRNQAVSRGRGGGGVNQYNCTITHCSICGEKKPKDFTIFQDFYNLYFTVRLLLKHTYSLLSSLFNI